MYKKLAVAFVLVLAGLWALLVWGDPSSIVRAFESVARPVFHKEIINRYCGIYKEDPLFVTAIIKVESNFSRKAKSHRGAVGLMQIMPATAQDIAQELKVKDFKIAQLEEPEMNIRFGFHHLSKLRKEFGEDDLAVLAAYNAGAKNVKSWLKSSGSAVLSAADIEFMETRNFVEDVQFTYRWLKIFQGWKRRFVK